MERINGLSGKVAEIPSLDISLLQVGTHVTCVAYALTCSLKIAVNGNEYAVFVLKDRHSNVITARLFNVEECFKNSFMVAGFNNRMVTFTAEVQEYDGRLSLVINGVTGVSLFTGDVDVGRFIGVFDVDLTAAEELYARLFPGRSLPSAMYKTLRIDLLAHGKVGAFAKIFDIAFGNLLFLQGVSGIKGDEFLKVFFEAMQHYYNVLVSHTAFSGLAKIQLYKEYALVESGCEKEYALIVIDTLKAMLDKAKPQHLYAHLISNAVLFAIQELELVEHNNTIAMGMQSRVCFHDCIGDCIRNGGADLLKY